MRSKLSMVFNGICFNVNRFPMKILSIDLCFINSIGHVHSNSG